MLNEWLIKNRRKLPRTDYGIVVLMTLTIVFFGFLEGVAIGMLVTAMFFAVRLSRIDLVESTFTSSDRRSSKAGRFPIKQFSPRKGVEFKSCSYGAIFFFGSAYPLVARLGRILASEPRPICMLLDFSAVSGVDLSALNSLCRFVQQARTAGVQVVVNAASPSLRDGLRRNLPSQVHASMLFGEEIDDSLEQCEDLLLASMAGDPSGKNAVLSQALLAQVGTDLEGQLDRLILFEELTDLLGAWMEPREYSAGMALVTSGRPPEGLQLLAAGRASALDSKEVRLLQYVIGDAIEPAAAFGSCSPDVSVIADEPCRTLMLTPEARERLEQDEQQLTVRLYRYLISASSRAGSVSGR